MISKPTIFQYSTLAEDIGTEHEGRKKAVLPIAIAVAAVGVVLLLMVGSGILASTQSIKGESIAIKGFVDLMVYDEFGELKEERHFDNGITNTGFEVIADRIADHSAFSGNQPNYIALGTGSTAFSTSQTSLVTELAGGSYARQQDTDATYTSGSKSFAISATFAAGVATGALTESGLFDAISSGNMMARQTFSTINVGAKDSITVTWTIALSNR